MMDEKEYESSDADDSDFKPDDEFSDDSAPSECESEVNEDDDEQEGEKFKKKSSKGQKKKTNKSRRRRRRKASVSADEESIGNISDNEDNSIKLTPEEEKARADSLWKSFLSDTATPSKSPNTKITPVSIPKASQDSNKSTDKKETTTSSIERKDDKTSSTITEITSEKSDKTASGTSEVAKKLAPASSTKLLPSANGDKSSPLQNNGLKKRGLSSILSNINKKPKLSTLEKSKHDWNLFKQENNLTEEINTFNRGKNGYLEKQDFLQRADLKQFEIEKELRNVGKRKLR